MNTTEVKPAEEYGNLIVKKGGFVHVFKIRMFEQESHGWVQTLTSNGKLYAPTDQTEYYEAGYTSDLSKYDEVWFEGVCVYKKGLIKRVLGKIFKGI